MERVRSASGRSRPGALSLGVVLVAAQAAGCAEGAQGDCATGACVERAACTAGRASAQFVTEEAPPRDMQPRRRAQVSVTVANCSGQTWTPGAFTLRPARGVAPSTWSVPGVPLPMAVPDGSSVRIPFDVWAPAATGTYPFSWAMEHDGVEVYEEPSPMVTVRVSGTGDCSAPGPPARFVDQIPPPAFLRTGAPVAASVTFANCGLDAWRVADGIAIASRGAPDDAWGPLTVALPFDVPPGRTVSFPVDGAAPTMPGRYSFSWQLLAGGAPAGDASPVSWSTVLEAVDCHGAPPALFVSQQAPGDAVPDQAIAASVRFGNCSGRTWGDGFALDTALGDGSRPWGVGPVALPFPVGVGFLVDIPFQAHAPHAPGTYPWRFGITTPEGALLDQPTPPLDVNVRCVPSCGDHNCGDDGCGGSCGSCGGNQRCDGAHCQCVPSCGDHNCGGDGCGGSCGNCGGNQHCDGAHCQNNNNNPCSGANSGNGAYCGGGLPGGDPSTLYNCQNKMVASTTHCPNGCHMAPPGVPDYCEPGNNPGGYKLPWCGGVRIEVTQGNNGDICGSHNGDHTGTQAFAFDFGLGRHSKVVASRGGTVTVAANVTGPGRACYDGCTQPFGTQAFWNCCNACINTSNHVNVAHGDGTVATYWHLDQATVTNGQHVNAGDMLGWSGTSGCSSGPHLHFMVMGNCPTGYCQSIPISFSEAGTPGCGAFVTSQNGCN